MKLKTLITILASSGRTQLIWKEREGLLKQVERIHSSFEDSTEPMSNPEVITDSILEMTDKISIYQRSQIDEIEILKRMPENEVEHIENLKKIIEKRNLEESKKEGSFVIHLTNDELYSLFSLEEMRLKQLNKIVN